MKSIIIYYSFSGNTQKVASLLHTYLQDKGQSELIRLKDLKEPQGFFTQARKALVHAKAEIAETKLNLTEYDLICLGTPVWAFGPAPAVNTYLARCFGLEGKEVMLFSTYGSGSGNTRCLNFMQQALAGKKAKGFRRFSVQQFKADNADFVISQIKKIGL
ncbi:MAG: NAD(P)H-dependent oxidoreductase [Candidatus Omnitrophota bacterium]